MLHPSPMEKFKKQHPFREEGHALLCAPNNPAASHRPRPASAYDTLCSLWSWPTLNSRPKSPTCRSKPLCSKLGLFDREVGGVRLAKRQHRGGGSGHGQVCKAVRWHEKTFDVWSKQLGHFWPVQPKYFHADTEHTPPMHLCSRFHAQLLKKRERLTSFAGDEVL